MIKDFISKKIESRVLYEGQYGLEIETETKKAYALPAMTFWNVKDDNSLRDYGKEYVLKVPVKYGAELDAALQEFHDKTKGIKFISDSISTSVHVHWNILPETWKTLGNFLTLYILTENLLIEYSGEFRRNNLFCLPIRSVPVLIDYIKNMLLSVENKSYNGCYIPVDYVKYGALNLSTITKFGSLEIRSMRGVTDIKIIKEWIDIINSIVVFSRQDLTPPKILDIYKELGEEMISDVFGKYYGKLNQGDTKELLKRNLFRAGKVGYCLTEPQWLSLDTKPEKKEVSVELLNQYAMDHFGIPYDQLSAAKKEHIEQMINIYGDNLVFKMKPKPKKALNQEGFYAPGGDFNVGLQQYVVNVGDGN